MPKKQYDKLKSENARKASGPERDTETAEELTSALINDIEQDSATNSTQFGKTDSNVNYDQYLGQLSDKEKRPKKQKGQKGNFLAEENNEFGLSNRVEQDGDRGTTSLLENLKTNKTTK